MENYPYYAYEKLGKEAQHKDATERKKLQLLLRIANFRQPHNTTLYNNDSDSVGMYIKEGCKKTEIITIKNGRDLSEILPETDLLIFNPIGNCIDDLGKISAKATEEAIFIIDNIHACEDNKKMWEQLKNNNNVGTTFELKHMGIAIFNKKIYQKHYLLNY